MSKSETASNLLQRAAAGESIERTRLVSALDELRENIGVHVELARACEDAGEHGLALREYQLALRDDPHDARVLERLVLLSEERGDLEAALKHAEALHRLLPGSRDALEKLMELLLASGATARMKELLREAPHEGMPDELCRQFEIRLRDAENASVDDEDREWIPENFQDGDIVRFIHLFSGRENVYARQWWSDHGRGGYSPVREPLTVRVGKNHLLGSITVGVYTVRLDDTVNFFAFDIDMTKNAMAKCRGDVGRARKLKEAVSREAKRMYVALEGLGLSPLLEDSGYKGRHLWILLEQPEPAAVVRRFGEFFLRAHQLKERGLAVEFFPKQDRVRGGLGNLIKLPLGIHRRTGRRCRLLDSDGVAVADPFAMLRTVKRTSRETLHAAIATFKSSDSSGPASLKPSTEEDRGHEQVEDSRALPAPPEAAPAWTEAHFEIHPEIATLFTKCHVLAALRQRVREHRRLTHDEQVVLTHATGHSRAGVLAVNYLLDACVDTPASARLKSPLRGNPISCPRVRKRIPHITGRVPCHCEFDPAPDTYPNPRLHVMDVEADAAFEPDGGAGGKPLGEVEIVDRARALGVLWARRQRLESEIAELELELVRHLEGSEKTEIETGDGVLKLHHEEGAPPALSWIRKNETDSEVASGGRRDGLEERKSDGKEA